MPLLLPKSVRRWLTDIPLRWVLTIPFVLPMIGATALAGYLSHRNGQMAVADLGYQLATGANEQVRQKLDTYLQIPPLVNRLNVDEVNQGRLDLRNTSAVESTLFQRFQQFDSVSAVLFVSPTGTFRFVERFPEVFLGVANPSQLDRLSIYHLDSQGRQEKLVRVVNNLDVRHDRPWYRQAVTTGKAGWSPIFQYGMTQNLTLNAFQPVYDAATKQLSGVFAVNLRLDYLNQFLRDLEISRFGQVIILEQNGNIIAASQGAPPAQTPPTASPKKRLNLYESQDGLLRSLGNLLRDRPDLQTPNQPQSLEFKNNGESYYAVITPLQNRSGLNWQILTTIPKSHFLGTIQKNTHQTILFSLLTLGAAVTLAILATNLLIERFVQFDRVSQELAGGDLDQRLPTDSSIAELNGLARAFNQMAEQLQQMFLRIHTALETSEAKFTTIFRTSPDPMAIARLKDGRLLEVNDSLLEFFGYARTEVIGRTALDLNFWNDQKQYQQYRELLEQQRFVRNLEVQFRTRAGIVKTVLLSVEIQNLEGQDCLVVVHRDISDRKRTEEKLRKTEQWLLQHDRLSPSNIYTLVEEPDGHIWFEYISSAVETIHEIPVEQVMQDATLLLNAQHPDDGAGYQDAVLKSKQSLSPFSHQWRIITPSGLVKWLQGNSQPEWRENGSIAWHGVVVDITDRKEAELTLQQSETRYRAIVEDQTELVTRSLPDTTLVFVNDAYCRFFGIQQEEVIGKSFCPLVYPEDEDSVIQTLASLSLHHPASTMENRVVVNGTIHWMQWVNRVLFDEQGNATEIQSVGRDITDLKRTEEALRRSDDLFRQLAETVREGFFIFETETSQYSYLNPACIRISGIPVDPSQEEQDFSRGMAHWFNNIHPDDRPSIEKKLQREREGENFDAEYRFIRPNGELCWLRSKAFPIQDDTGKVVRVVGTVEDITERKQAEEALRASEERFRRAFDDAPIGISLVSVTGQFLEANAFYCNLLGYSEAELLQIPFWEITHSADLEEDMKGFQQMRAGEIPSFEMEKRYITRQGDIIPTLMRAAPIRNAEGQILYFVGHIQDIRDRLKVERMKDEFISIISHELRTPLTSIRGALGILDSGVYNDRPDKTHQMLHIALNNSDRLVRLVNDILDLERLDSGKVKLVKQPCLVADLMQQAVESVQTIADQSGITLSQKSFSETIWVSPDAIVQTLTNLLSNAIKFSSSGGVVWLKAERVGEDIGGIGRIGEIGEIGRNKKVTSLPSPPSSPLSQQILFSIADQGRGIPEDKLEIIFEQFQQVNVSDSRKKGGTGLGLAICKRIVQQHGGRIWVESSQGQGSTFYFTIPLGGSGGND